jgi:hypothetical protein
LSIVDGPLPPPPSRRIIDRRRFLAWVVIGIACGASLLWLGRGGRWRAWATASASGSEPVAPLAPASEAALAAAIGALLEHRVDPSSYLALFRWRAHHMPGAAALYVRFQRRVDAVARGHGHASFASAPPELQQRILAPFRPRAGWARAWRALARRDDERFSRHIVRSVFRRFARTDAWLLTGYDTWPGMPRAIASLAPQGRR